MDSFKLNRDIQIKNQGRLSNREKAIRTINFLLDTNYIYNFDWFGIPIIQFPSDMIVLQEIIYKTKPDIIIECGIGRGGSLIFYSSLLKILKKNYKIFGIDIKIGKNRKIINNHFLSKNIKLIEKSSIDTGMIKNLVKKISKKDKVLVILDSNHSHDHVLKELNLYSTLVTKNSYLIVLDTAIEFVNKRHINKGRDFGKGNSPHTAVKKFIKESKNFKIDKLYENKAYISSAYDGFLKKIR